MELSGILNGIYAVTLVLGILFGLIQLRHYHLSRKREATLFLLNSFQTGEFMQGIWIIQELPNGLTKEEIEDRLGDEMKFVYLVVSTWERIGFLVFNHEISIDMVDNAYSDPIKISWQRLEEYVSDLREVLQRETQFEWFQWLAERMMERERVKPPTPAYLAYRDWE